LIFFIKYIYYKNLINYMKKISKVVLSISVDKQLTDLMRENISNKSKYVEWLIYQNMKSNNVNGVEKIII
jgi:hypothetical protein